MDRWSYLDQSNRKQRMIRKYLIAFSFILFCWVSSFSQSIPLRILEQPKPELAKGTSQAEAIIAKAVKTLGGDKYLQVKSQVGRGIYSTIRDGAVVSFQTFVDVVVFPDKQRSEFKGKGTRSVQANSGDSGWVYDGEQELIKIQNEAQRTAFKQQIRASLDNLLRGYWRGDAELTYVGKRASTVGKRNDVLKLTYKDGFVVEFEFTADEGLPQKAIYKRLETGGEPITEEDRYAQFLDFGGIKSPFVIDRFTDGKQTSRINFETIAYNKTISDSAFVKPASPKEARREFKY